MSYLNSINQVFSLQRVSGLFRELGHGDIVALTIINSLFIWLFFSISEPHLDTYGDMVENYAWGITWSLGNNKHPPLFGWVTAVWFYIFPTKNSFYYLLSAVNMLVTSAFLTMSMRQFLDSQKTFVALALTLVVLPLSIDHGYKYNANLAQLPFLTGYLWALLTAVKSDRHSRYMIAGVMAGAAILCKYSAVLILGPITLTTLFYLRASHFQWIKALVIIGLVSALILTPHVCWEFKHHWPSLLYIDDKPTMPTEWKWLMSLRKNIFDFTRFISWPAMLLGLSLFLSSHHTKKYSKPPVKTPKFGLLVIFLCLFFTVLSAFVEKLKIDSSWLIVCTIFLGWALFDLLPPSLNFHVLAKRLKISVYAYFIVALIVVAWCKTANHHTAVNQGALPEIFAKDLTSYYHQKYHGNLVYVAGSEPLAYDVTFYSPDHPWGIYRFDLDSSTWINQQDPKLKRKVIVCSGENHYLPRNPECSSKAIKLFGVPKEIKEFSYPAYDTENKLYRNITFEALVY